LCRRHVDHVVDDGRVVNIGEDDVVRRRRDIDRRPHEDRHRHEQRLRQNEQPDRRDRRRQHHEVRRRRRQEEYWWWRRRHEVEIGIAEIEHGPIEIGDFVRRWRRHVVIHHHK
jgi:hypothetical protein